MTSLAPYEHSGKQQLSNDTCFFLSSNSTLIFTHLQDSSASSVFCLTFTQERNTFLWVEFMHLLRTKCEITILHILGILGQAEELAIDRKTQSLTLGKEIICAGRACVCAHGSVNRVVRGKPYSHAASESKKSLRAASLNMAVQGNPCTWHW